MRREREKLNSCKDFTRRSTEGAAGYLYRINPDGPIRWCQWMYQDKENYVFGFFYWRNPNRIKIPINNIDSVKQLPILYTMRCIISQELEKDVFSGAIESWRIFSHPFPLDREINTNENSLWLMSTYNFGMINVFSLNYLKKLGTLGFAWFDLRKLSKILWAGPIDYNSLDSPKEIRVKCK